MTSGIIVEKTTKNEYAFWTVKDVKTNNVLAVGDSAASAVSNYETAVENQKIAMDLGVSLEDMDV